MYIEGTECSFFNVSDGGNELVEVKDDNPDVTLACNECKCGGGEGSWKEWFYCIKCIEILYKTNHLREHKNNKHENEWPENKTVQMWGMP